MNQLRLIIVLGLIAMVGLPALAYDLELNGVYYNLDLVNMTASVTYENGAGQIAGGKSSYAGDVLIPPSITFNNKEFIVEAIGKYAFSNCKSLVSISIPSSITKIEEGAFYCCYKLTSIELPDELISIGAAAFEFCNCLVGVSIPRNVREIGDFAFADCRNIKSLKFADGSNVTCGDNCLERVSPANIYFGGVLHNPSWSVSKLNEITFTSESKIIVNVGFKQYDYEYYCGDNLQVVNVMSETPPAGLEYLSFSNKAYLNATLYVPKGCKETYQNAEGWKNFFTIEEKDFSGIEGVAVDSQAAREVVRYNVSGQLLDRPVPGINIVRYSDGTTKKVLVR